MYKTLLFLSIFFLKSIVFEVNAQSDMPKTIEGVNYGFNVSQPFSDVEKRMLQEVYGSSLKNNVLSNSQRVKDIKDILRNRVSVKYLPNYSKPCELLSEVPLFNKYNSKLRRQRFNKDAFNPLRYNFHFYSKETKIYRIDDTDYYVIIKSQHQK